MDKEKIKDALKVILSDEYVLSEEYQDKYYLSKEICEMVPELSERRVYEAIEFANLIVKAPRKNVRFIEAFLKKL